MVKTGQRLKRKVAARNLKKEGSEENKEDNQTTRRKEAKSNLEEEDKNNKTINQRWDQPPNKATTRSTSPETVQSSWMYARMLMGKEK